MKTNSLLGVFLILSFFALTSASVDCGDGWSCPNHYTCCPALGGGYGCCPYDHAKCCADKIHCVPSGESCNSNQMFCKNKAF